MLQVGWSPWSPSTISTLPVRAEQSAGDTGHGAAARRTARRGGSHTCIVDEGGGSGAGEWFFGQLGYGNTDTIGDTEHPSTAGAVDLDWADERSRSPPAPSTHALADDATVRCWGTRLQRPVSVRQPVSIGGDESRPPSAPVQLGTRGAITAGDDHTCAILDDWTVRCWGVGFTYFGSGHLGYGNTPTTSATTRRRGGRARRPRRRSHGEGDHRRFEPHVRHPRHRPGALLGFLLLRPIGRAGSTETSATTRRPEASPRWTSVPVARRPPSARAANHTCVVLDDGSVRCWGSLGGRQALRF